MSNKQICINIVVRPSQRDELRELAATLNTTMSALIRHGHPQAVEILNSYL